MAWIRQHYAEPLVPPTVVTGDVDGDGLADAVAIFNVPSGGSAAYQHLLVMKGDGASFTPLGVREQIVGINPHDIVIRRAVVEYTGTILGPTDPHCCPRTSQRFRVTVSNGRISDSEPVKDAGGSSGVPARQPPPSPPSSSPKPGPLPAPAATAPPRDARDVESLSAFLAFVKATQPERMRRDDVLGRLGSAQLAAQKGAPLNVPVVPDPKAPPVSVTPLRDGTTGAEWCREFSGQTDGVTAIWIGCHGTAGVWRYVLPAR